MKSNTSESDFLASIEELRQGKIRIVEDILALSAHSSTEAQLLSEGVRASIDIPLLAQGELIGSLHLGADRPAAFTAEQVDIVRPVANQLAIAIQQAHLHTQVRSGRLQGGQLNQMKA